MNSTGSEKSIEVSVSGLIVAIPDREISGIREVISAPDGSWRYISLLNWFIFPGTYFDKLEFSSWEKKNLVIILFSSSCSIALLSEVSEQLAKNMNRKIFERNNILQNKEAFCWIEIKKKNIHKFRSFYKNVAKNILKQKKIINRKYIIKTRKYKKHKKHRKTNKN